MMYFGISCVTRPQTLIWGDTILYCQLTYVDILWVSTKVVQYRISTMKVGRVT